MLSFTYNVDPIEELAEIISECIKCVSAKTFVEIASQMLLA